ncbi:MAG: glutamate--tRNA ligase family protein [Candidatus Pacearchaeota archaeon]
MKIKQESIRAYTLKNAVEHEGKAVSGSVIPGLFNCGLQKEQIKEIMPLVEDVVKQVNKLSLDSQKKEFDKLKHLIGHRPEREGLPELENAKKGKVITRMAPSPSGPFHIGHILTIGPNFLYARKYNGKFYLRIEDTNPENIYPKAYKMLENEIKWLCNNQVEIVIQSNRMSLYYKYLEKLFDKNAVYVCTCSVEDFKKYSDKKKDCPCRSLTEREQFLRWKKMLDKNGYGQGEAVVRFKSGMQLSNPAMRDFPLARINLTKHPLQGNKYRVWPLMNLSVSVDDIETKVTHIIRGKDHMDNAERQKMIFKALGKKYPWTAFIGRLNFKDLELSTTQMRKDIEAGKYSGWDDLRLPTAASLKKQGYKPEAFWKFVEQRGISEVDKVISKEDFYKVLDDFNKEVK